MLFVQQRRSAHASMRNMREHRPALERLEERALMSTGIAEFPLPSGSAASRPIVQGPDGNLWFATSNIGGLPGTGKIAKITPAGVVTVYALPSNNAYVLDMTAGPDGDVWFTEYDRNGGGGGHNFKIGRITPAGNITEYALPAGVGGAMSITAGPDGNLWFSELFVPRLGRITPQGVVTQFDIPFFMPSTEFGVKLITAGNNHDLWFLGFSQVGRITTDGQTTSFPLPLTGQAVDSIAFGPDGNIWLSGGGTIDRMTPAGVVTTESSTQLGFSPGLITNGPDGDLWVTEQGVPAGIARVTPSFGVTLFALPHGTPFSLASGPGNTLWYTDSVLNGWWGVGELDLQSTDAAPIITPQPILMFKTPKDIFGIVEYNTFGGRIASFTDADPHAQASDFFATVDFIGSRWYFTPTTVPAQVVANDHGGFDVFATVDGFLSGPLTVSIFHTRPSSGTTAAVATVQVPVSTFTLPLSGQASLQALASSTAAQANAGWTFAAGRYQQSELSVFVDWGDGTRPVAVPFEFTSGKTYANGGDYYFNSVNVSALKHVYAHHGPYVVHFYLLENKTTPLSAVSAAVLV